MTDDACRPLVCCWRRQLQGNKALAAWHDLHGQAAATALHECTVEACSASTTNVKVSDTHEGMALLAKPASSYKPQEHALLLLPGHGMQVPLEEVEEVRIARHWLWRRFVAGTRPPVDLNRSFSKPPPQGEAGGVCGVLRRLRQRRLQAAVEVEGGPDGFLTVSIPSATGERGLAHRYLCGSCMPRGSGLRA